MRDLILLLKAFSVVLIVFCAVFIAPIVIAGGVIVLGTYIVYQLFKLDDDEEPPG